MKPFKPTLLPLAATVFIFLLLNPSVAQSQLTPEDEEASLTVTESSIPELDSTTISVPTTTSEEMTTSSSTIDSTSATATTIENTESTTALSSDTPEGYYDSPCNMTLDCQPNKYLQCLDKICRCDEPAMFDIREQKCIVPLGKECCESEDNHESNCPEFAECFMDRCVCKTGYSMFTMTRCKSDFSQLAESTAEANSKSVLWPKQSLDEDTKDKTGCTPTACDESKGLECQVGGACKCKDPKELFVEEFGRCLSTRMQKSLKDALSLVSSSEDDIKSFVKLLEKFEDGDHETSASEHESSSRPIHQLLDLLGGDKDDAVTPPSTRSQLAPPSRSYNRYGDLHSSAQEPVTETTAPSGAAGGDRNNAGADAEVGSSAPSPPDDSHLRAIPPRQDPIPTGDYGIDSREHYRDHDDDHYHLPLDGLQQGQEPAIVQRQAPAYGPGYGDSQGHGNPYGYEGHHGYPARQGYGNHASGIPLHGYGVIPEGTVRIPFGIGQGGQQGQGYRGPPGGYGGPGGPGGPGGYGGPGGGQRPPPPPPPGGRPPQREGLLIEMAEVLGRSFKLIDRFLPLIYVINDALKKEGIFDKKPGGPREGREVDKGELLKEGAMIAGFAKFMGLLLRLKKRLDLLGGADGLKKLLS